MPQRETTPFHPRSPYGTAKVFGYRTTLNCRESYGIHASNGILFNHTSLRRGLEFVERKISNAVARISLGLQGSLTLGNIATSRDFGYAGDYVEAMWRMLRARPTGRLCGSHRENLDCASSTGPLAFGAVGIDDWATYVETDERFRRPPEVDHHVGDASKAREVLGWEPKAEFPQVLEEMVHHDIALEKAKSGLS